MTIDTAYKLFTLIPFRSGSVIATVHLTFDSSLGKPDDLLNEMKGVIPARSDTDDRTNRVEPTDIVIGTLMCV